MRLISPLFSEILVLGQHKRLAKPAEGFLGRRKALVKPAAASRWELPVEQHSLVLMLETRSFHNLSLDVMRSAWDHYPAACPLMHAKELGSLPALGRRHDGFRQKG